MKLNFKVWNINFSDIRIWLLLAFVLHLYHIHFPPLDAAHTWREVDVLGVARNFLEIDANIFFPRVSFAGDKTGITGMEFPTLNYLIFLIAKIFGFHVWIARIINLSISSLGLYYLYKIIRDYIHKDYAFNTTLLVIFSIWFGYSRKILPDVLATSLAFIGIYYGLAYLYKKIKAYLVLYLLFTLFACLTKIPIALMFSIFLLPVLSKKVEHKIKIFFILVSCLAILPSYIWYQIWVPHLNTKYGYTYFFMGRSVFEGLTHITQYFFTDFAHQIYKSQMRYLGFLTYCLGSYTCIKYRKEKPTLFYFFLLSLVSLLFFMLKAGISFHHAYYSIWWMPSMALMASIGLSKIQNKKIVQIILVCICLENIIYYIPTFGIQKNKDFLLNLEKIMDTYTEKSDLIFINSDSDPQAMYFAHRKGWLNSNRMLHNKEYIAKIKEQGCKYILILRKISEADIELNSHFKEIYLDTNIRLYKI